MEMIKGRPSSIRTNFVENPSVLKNRAVPGARGPHRG